MKTLKQHRKCRSQLVTLGVATAIVIGFWGAQVFAEPVTVKFWKAPHSPNELALWEPIIAGFEASHPDIKIEHLVTPWATWVEQYSAGFTSGEPPCVSYMVDWLSAPFANRNQFVDLDKAGYSAQVVDAYPEHWMHGNIGGHQVGIPFATVPRMWMYNVALFESAGVTPPTDDWTWADFMSTVRALKSGGVKFPYAIDMTAANFGYQDFLPWLWNAGGDVLTDDGTGSRVNEPAAYETIEMIQGIIEEGLAPPLGNYTVSEGENLFMRGGVALYNMRAIALPQIRDEFPDLRYGIVKAPAGPEGQFNFQDWGYFALAKQCESPEAGWEWMKHITSKEVTEQYLAPTGLFPARGDTNLFADDEEAQVFLASMSNTKNMPIHIRTIEIMDAWWSEVERSMLGQQSAQQASDNAHEALLDLTEE